MSFYSQTPVSVYGISSVSTAAPFCQFGICPSFGIDAAYTPTDSLMHLRRIFLMTLVTVLVMNSVLKVTGAGVSLIEQVKVAGRGDRSDGRILRAAKTNNEIDNVEGSPGEDERANSISSFLSKARKKISLFVKTTVWLERYKSVDYVQEKLGMKGLTGAELLSHENYKRLQNYAKNLRENIIWRDVRQGKSTYTVWNDVGLNKKTAFDPKTTLWKEVPDDAIRAQLEKIRGTRAFKKYEEYAVAFDDYQINLYSSDRPAIFFDKNATPLEKMARIQIWVTTKRPKAYVKEFLNLEHANQQKLSSDRFYQFYLKELEKMNKV